MNVVGHCAIVVFILLLVLVDNVVFGQFLLNVQSCNFGNYYFALTNSLIAAQHCTKTCIVRQPHANAVYKDAFEYINRQEPCNASCVVSLKNITGAVGYKQITRFIAMPPPSLRARIESLCPFIDRLRQALPLVSDDIAERFTDNDTLVAHIRSGDIFTTSIHPRYWQPPLGFYQYAARQFAKIVICAQNQKNPVVKALYDYCNRTRGAQNCLLRVGMPLRDDVAFLLRARNLAIGWGTFGVAIYAMSARIRRLYYPVTLLTLLDYLIAMPIVNNTSQTRCQQPDQIVGIRIAYNIAQITKNENWRADAGQIAMLLTDQSAMQQLREDAIEMLF